MVNKSRRQITNVPEKPVELSDVNEIGVYYKDHTGKWIAIEPEIVHIKSGGWLKSTATHGIIKEDHNGHLNGRESKLALQCPIDILIYVPEGVVGERVRLPPLPHQLRQPRVPRSYRRRLPLDRRRRPRRSEVQPRQNRARIPTSSPSTKDTGGGEYGILPPGTGNVTNGGKIYTFAIVE